MVAPVKLLDLFCGIGGCSVGYARAGWTVTGADLMPMPDYPFPFVQGDALEILNDRTFLAQFDVIHASPPCPRYSALTKAANRDMHPDLLAPVTAALKAWGGVYVVENVPGAPVANPLVLCGSEFGLGLTCRDGVWRQLRRHRLFDSNVPMMRPGGCSHRGDAIGVYGIGGGGGRASHAGKAYKGHADERAAVMGIDWTTNRKGISNAIPPAYTTFIGECIRDYLEAAA